jgi:hypothetical protein
MPAETRKSNRNANYTAYFPKPLPKQRYFPHRRKVVRRSDPGRQDGSEKRQMTFLPEMMRRRGTVQDSEGEDGEEEEGIEERVVVSAENELGNREGRRGKKRRSDVTQLEEEDAAVRPAPKRTKRVANKSRRRVSAAAAASIPDDDECAPQSSVSASESEHEEERKPRLRRQSTMTQLVEGRRPNPEDIEPEFKLVKMGPRTSWGNTKKSRQEKDRQQRTLTQMVRGLVPPSDEETEEELENDEEYSRALSEHLTQSGVFEPSVGHGLEAYGPASNVEIGEKGAEKEQDAARPSSCHDTVALADGVDADDEYDEDEYNPTQELRALALDKRRTARRVSTRTLGKPTVTPESHTTPRKRTSRFSLLATPERRKVIIPSSQSPPESPLSTQRTPGSHRLPLRERAGNAHTPQETPSKRKKVAFQEAVEHVPEQPIARRKFGSMVQDSEDEDELIEEDVVRTVEGTSIGAETQRLIFAIENPLQGRNVGAETQAMLDQIDKACANEAQDVAWRNREESIELGVQHQDEEVEEESQTLECQDELDVENMPTSSQVPPKQIGHPEGTEAAGPVHRERTPDNEVAALLNQGGNFEPPVTPTTPRIIKAEPISQIQPPTPSPEHPNTSRPASATFDTTDLDGHPIQVARSPTPQNPNAESQITDVSHSSKAEQQLQTEWLSYSQYARPPPSSSMRVLQDSHTPISQQSTPYPNQVAAGAVQANVMAPPPAQWANGDAVPPSQATTADDFFTQRSPAVTPKKPLPIPNSANATPHTLKTPSRHSRFPISANTTPNKIIPSSQPLTLISPQKPDTLVIPSSFPSPGGVGMGSWRGGDWSSPVMEARSSQMASVEGFSIPALPPGFGDDLEEEEEEL